LTVQIKLILAIVDTIVPPKPDARTNLMGKDSLLSGIEPALQDIIKVYQHLRLLTTRSAIYGTLRSRAGNERPRFALRRRVGKPAFEDRKIESNTFASDFASAGWGAWHE
jgi:hypothetical protein